MLKFRTRARKWLAVAGQLAPAPMPLFARWIEDALRFCALWLAGSAQCIT